MQALFRGFLLGFCAIFLAQPILAQTSDPNITPNGVIAEVKVIDAASKQLIVKTDAGSLVTVSVADTTTYKKVQPGQTGLTGATDITFAQIAEGDRIFARGKPADDKKSVVARMVILMSKADIAKKQDEERAEWRRRGLLGVITALNPANKEITISTRSMAGTQPVIIPVSEKVEMRRYAPDSIKFADAKTAKFEELQVGDQLRALGDRTPDGARFNAERIVTGSFRTVAGVVTALDPATGEVKINDLQSKQPLTIVVKQDAVLRKFPADMAQMMMGGRGQAGGGGNAQGQGQTTTTTTVQAAGGGAPQGGGAGGPRPGGGGIQDMLERLPTIAIADVKVGDTIVVSSTKGADASRLTAITLVTGAETLLNMMAAGGGAGGGGFQGFQMGIGLP
jgi:hypothetical protein